MLARALVAGLRTRFAAVTGPDLSLAADRRVVATLDRFEEVTGAGTAQAVVAFDVTQVAQGKARRVAVRKLLETERAVGVEGPLDAALPVVVLGNYELHDGDVVRGSTP